MVSQHKNTLFMVLLSLFLFAGLQGKGQDTSDQNANKPRITVVSGFGVPEMFYLGARIGDKNTSLGLSVGTIPGDKDGAYTLNLDARMHLWGFSRFTSDYPWYGQLGFTYGNEKSRYRELNYGLLNVRLGKEFYISESFGLSLEGGLFFKLYEDEVSLEHKNPMISNKDFESSVYPGVNVGMFYKF